jgi:type IX secretion system PorP/SprF family membrane protein
LYVTPAYAGSHEVVSLVGIYRHQWVGMDGAPRTVNVSAHMPFKRTQYALGLTLANDKIGLSNNFSFTPAFSYRLKIKQTRLCFGIQASFAYFYRDNSKSDLPQVGVDNSLIGQTNLFQPNIGVGIYWYGKKFFVGASAPHLMPTALRGKTNVVSYNKDIARVYDYYVFTAGYLVGKEAAIVKFRPTILMKWQKGLPNNIPQFDFNAALLFIDRIWIGASFRTAGNAFTKKGKPMKFGPEGIIGYFQVRITPQFQLGYAYDGVLSSLNRGTSGSHEIMLGYDFWYNKKRFVNTRYVSYF